MTEIAGLRLSPNWTSAAGALEGVLEFLGEPLPRHAIMGLSGHAWHLAITTREGVAVLPDGVMDLDWAAMVDGYARTGYRWERFGGSVRPGEPRDDIRDAAIGWVKARIDEGRPIIGWDFQLHEFAIVYGYDDSRDGALVHSVTSPELGPLSPWAEWPSAAGVIELFAPLRPADGDAGALVREALGVAVAMLEGMPTGPAPVTAIGREIEGEAVRGTDALDHWAEVMDGDGEVDRAGNAYVLQVLQAARVDGAAFLGDLVETFPEAREPLEAARRAMSEVTTALAPLVTLFPFPSGGHGNVANAGLRRAAAMALRRAARAEREATAAMAEAESVLAKT